MTYRCIKPHCPTTCDGCNHAIPDVPGARILIVRLLDEYAKDDLGHTFETGDHPLIDEARAFLTASPAPAVPHSFSTDTEAPTWASCATSPRTPGTYEMRHAGGLGYQGAVTWDGTCWFDSDGEAIMFLPLSPHTHEWRTRV